MDGATRLPLLYSFRRCPYAIRARMAIASANITVELHEVALRDKPAELLSLSPKGTVPVLRLPDGRVLEESLDIMRWALAQHDPGQWLSEEPARQAETRTLIEDNDGPFKTHLDHYKYATRHPEHPAAHYRRQAEQILSGLEGRLRQHRWLLDEKSTIADIALFPFVRQFAFVDKEWFDQAGWPALQRWLDAMLESELFRTTMVKFPVHQAGDRQTLFPCPG